MSVLGKNIFHAETDCGHIFKVFIELLSGLNFRRCCLKISKKGICMRDMDQFKKVLFDVFLDRDNFKFFEYEFEEETICFSFGVLAFKRLISTIKRKDSLGLFIRDPSLKELIFVIKPRYTEDGLFRKDENQITISQQEENFVSLPPDEYEEDNQIKKVYSQPVVLGIQEMQKLKKPCANSVSGGVSIKIQKEFISFCGTDDLTKNKITFGTEKEGYFYEKTFESFKISQLSRSTGFGGLIRFYAPLVSECPLKIVMDMGGIGKFSLYVKDKEQIEKQEIEQREKKIEEEAKTEQKVKKKVRKILDSQIFEVPDLPSEI
jgi:hypothetical protein